MTDFATMLQEGPSWLFVPSAILLGALHGLEPGHSKTMMAAFIVAVRGTVSQAVLLGLSATLSHTAVVWAIALAGLYYGQQWNEGDEAWLQLVSGAVIIGVALWMMARIHGHQQAAGHGHDHDHHHDHDHDHDHDHGHAHPVVRDAAGLDVSAPGYQDPHEQAHAEDIRRRFANSEVSTGQIILFGLTGGLIPCPASITVLLLCLHLKKLVLGVTLVLCFSIGLALTMVLSGVIAALSVRHISQHWSGFDAAARRAPYLSGMLILIIGLYMGYQGISALD